MLHYAGGALLADKVGLDDLGDDMAGAGKGKKKRRGFHYYQKADYKKVYVKLRERWFPPPGFAVQAVDGDASKGHKPKTSPVKGGNQSHWLRNDEGE